MGISSRCRLTSLKGEEVRGNGKLQGKAQGCPVPPDIQFGTGLYSVRAEDPGTVPRPDTYPGEGAEEIGRGCLQWNTSPGRRIGRLLDTLSRLKSLIAQELLVWRVGTGCWVWGGSGKEGRFVANR